MNCLVRKVRCREMSSMIVYVPSRGVRSLNPHHFNAPWPFVKVGRTGQRKIGPRKFEKFDWPGQNREFPELSPKFQKLNPEELRDYTGCQSIGYTDPVTKKFVIVEEMKPELVVPDLTNFRLKPYVSYKTDAEIEKRQKAYEAAVRKYGSPEKADAQVKEDERWPPPALSARALFDIFYADKVRQYFASGTYDHPANSPKRRDDTDSQQSLSRNSSS